MPKLSLLPLRCFAVTASLAGCSASPGPTSVVGAQPPNSALTAGVQVPATGSCPNDSLFVSDYGANVIYGYSIKGKNSTICATLSSGISGPQGVATDKSRHLYIANTNDAEVIELAPPYTSSSIVRTISEPTEFPVGVAVSSAGLTAAINLCSAPSCSQGNVAFFRKGATTPCASVSSSDIYRPYFGAFDAAGNLYVSGENASFAPVFGEITSGCKAKTFAQISIPGIANPDLFGIDTQGNIGIYAAYSGSQVDVDVFAPGNFNQPKFTFAFEGGGGVVAFERSGKGFWTALSGSGDAAEFDYPRGGAPIKTVSDLVEAIGVALTPVAEP